MEEWMYYFEDLTVSGSLYISAEAAELMGNLATALAVAEFRDGELVGLDQIETTYNNLAHQIQKEVSASKILDNSEFKRILKGKTIGEKRREILERLKK